MTTSSIEIPFALGVQVWHAAPISTEEVELCPECLGTKKIRIVQPNGDEFEQGCAACYIEYGMPCGQRRIHRCKFYPREYTPTGVERIDDQDGVTYKNWPSGTGGGSLVCSRRLRATKEACEVLCAEMTAASRVEEDKRHEVCLRISKEKYAWSLNYWRSQRADHVRQIELIDMRMKQIKESKMHLKMNETEAKHE